MLSFFLGCFLVAKPHDSSSSISAFIMYFFLSFFCSCKVNQKIQAGYEGGKEKLICNYFSPSFCHCQIVNSLHSTKNFSELFSTKGQPSIISDGSLCSYRGTGSHIMLHVAYTIFSVIISLQCLQLPSRRKDHPGPFESKETILLALPSGGL